MQNERLYGIDIARILAMFLVVLFHAIGVFSGYDESCTASRILRSATICCVDLFALISGYVGVRSNFRPSRFVALWIQTVFTGIIIISVGTLAGLFHPTIKDIGKVIAPISSYAYWYLTAYFLLFLTMPFLNAGFATLPKRTIAFIMTILGFLVVLIPALNPCHSDTYILSHGLSGIWLIVCYIIGGGIRLLDKGKGSSRFWFLTSLVLVAINFFWSGGYSHPAVLALAVSYLMTCIRVKIHNEKVQNALVFLSSCAFGVYIWHVQPLLHGKMVNCLHFVTTWEWYIAVPALFAFSIAIYLSISILEFIRMLCFKKCRIDVIVRKIDMVLIGAR